jgi:FMN reductase (NADPH)
MIEEIVVAAQHASTSSALQAYSVIAVTVASKREILSELCNNQDHIRQAPLFLAWCADLSRLGDICKGRGYTQVTEYIENFLVAAFDAMLASQNAALAAESMGLGVCFIGSIRRKSQEVIDLLGLPNLVFPVVGMTIGWPSHANKLRPRLPLEIVLHWEEYDKNPKTEALQAYDKTMIETGIYDYLQSPASEGSKQSEYAGWLEVSARRASKADRIGLRNCIEKQGFALK